MNRTIFVLLLFLLSVLVYAREVPANNRGIANASPGDYKPTSYNDNFNLIIVIVCIAHIILTIFVSSYIDIGR
jgi:hypothetical protein